MLAKVKHKTGSFRAGAPIPTDLKRRRTEPSSHPRLYPRCRAVLPYVCSINKPHTTISNAASEAPAVHETPPIPLRKGVFHRFRVFAVRSALSGGYVPTLTSGSRKTAPARMLCVRIERGGAGPTEGTTQKVASWCVVLLPSRLFGRSDIVGCSGPSTLTSGNERLTCNLEFWRL